MNIQPSKRTIIKIPSITICPTEHNSLAVNKRLSSWLTYDENNRMLKNKDLIFYMKPSLWKSIK